MPATDVIFLLREMRLEAAIRQLKTGGGPVDAAAVKTMILESETLLRQAGSSPDDCPVSSPPAGQD
jgi:hypothetical protein